MTVDRRPFLCATKFFFFFLLLIIQNPMFTLVDAGSQEVIQGVSRKVDKFNTAKTARRLVSFWPWARGLFGRTFEVRDSWIVDCF
uniref:Putative secreted protein n=1 Tax=Ixodes scapularis TaxID=6945 RepID=A0A4D5RBX0_IXOSC